MTENSCLPAIRFLEDRIDALVFALNYLRNHAGLPPRQLDWPRDPTGTARPGTTS